MSVFLWFPSQVQVKFSSQLLAELIPTLQSRTTVSSPQTGSHRLQTWVSLGRLLGQSNRLVASELPLFFASLNRSTPCDVLPADFYCRLTGFLSFVLYMMGSPLDRGNGGGQLCSWTLVWWCLSVVFPKTVPKRSPRFSPRSCACMAWCLWNNLIHASSPLFLMCACASSRCVLTTGHQCGFPNSFMDPFQSLKLQGIKGTRSFSLVRDIS